MTDELPLRELHLFAGAGGGILGGELLGHTCVCAVEIEEYPRRVLLQRQRDGILPRFPIWDDICTFDGKPWRGRVDVVCGGFPCQDISSAGKGAGIGGKRSGLWSEMARVISEIQPRFVFVENSPLLVSRGLDVVLSDLAALGYDCRWGIVGAHHAGAPHKRDRIWILADANSQYSGNERQDQVQEDRQMDQWQTVVEYDGESQHVADADEERLRRRTCAKNTRRQDTGRHDGKSCAIGGAQRREWWAAEPDLGRVAHGVAARVDRLKAIGNGQVPAVAALAWRLLGGPV